MIVGTAAALLCVNTDVYVGPVAGALDGADLSAIVGPVVAAGIYAAHPAAAPPGSHAILRSAMTRLTDFQQDGTFAAMTRAACSCRPPGAQGKPAERLHSIIDRYLKEMTMTRYGAQFGPDITFLGVDRCDWADPATLRRRRRRDPRRARSTAARRTGRAPGSGRSTSARPDYLPHDGSRPSLALRVDALQDLRVYDAGDVEMFSGDAERSVRDLQEAVYAVTAPGAIPLVLGGDHTIAWPDAAGRRPAPRPGPGLDDPLRRARRHRRHRVRLARSATASRCAG